MRRRPAILLLLALALVIPACGGGDDDAGGTTRAGRGRRRGDRPSNSGTPTGRQGSSPAGTWWPTPPLGVTQVGLSADLIDVGLGWVVGHRLHGRPVGAAGRADGRGHRPHPPGRLPLGHGHRLRPRSGWPCPSEGKVVAVDPETGTSSRKAPRTSTPSSSWRRGRCDAAGSNYYWKVDEVSPARAPGAEPWQFKIRGRRHHPGPVRRPDPGAGGGHHRGGQRHRRWSVPRRARTGRTTTIPAIPRPSSRSWDDGSHPAGGRSPDGLLQLPGGHRRSLCRPPRRLGRHVADPQRRGERRCPWRPSPACRCRAPRRRADPGFGPGVWVGYGDPPGTRRGLLRSGEPPVSFDASSPSPLAARSTTPCSGSWSYARAERGRHRHAGRPGGRDGSAPPSPWAPSRPTRSSTPGLRAPASRLAASATSGADHLLNGMEGTTDPGTTVRSASRSATPALHRPGHGSGRRRREVHLPRLDLDDLTTPIPAGATITVVLTGDGNDLGACRLEVET